MVGSHTTTGVDRFSRIRYLRKLYRMLSMQLLKTMLPTASWYNGSVRRWMTPIGKNWYLYLCWELASHACLARK